MPQHATSFAGMIVTKFAQPTCRAKPASAPRPADDNERPGYPRCSPRATRGRLLREGPRRGHPQGRRRLTRDRRRPRRFSLAGSGEPVEVEGGGVELDAEVEAGFGTRRDARDGRAVRLEVRRSGPGLRQLFPERAFERATRLTEQVGEPEGERVRAEARRDRL